MKDFINSITKASYIGKRLRMIIVACILMYTVTISALIPLLTATHLDADASGERISSASVVDPAFENSGRNPVLDGIQSPFNSNDIESELSEKDEYSNTWDDETDFDATVLYEDKSLRTANEKHFKMSDGTYSLISHANSIHYLDDNTGEYEEIDNSLEKNGNVYKNKANAMEVELPVSYLKNSKTRIIYGDYGLTFKLDKYTTSFDTDTTIDNVVYTNNVKSKNSFNYQLRNKSKAKYRFNNGQVELEQVLIGTQLKENIIVHRKLTSYIFSFDIKTKELYLKLVETGDIHAVSKSTDEIIFVIPKGFMFDSIGARSNNVSYSLTERGGGYTLQVMPDEDWLNATERVFPITIDPTVSVNNVSEFKSAAQGTINNGIMPVSNNSMAFLDFNLPESVRTSTILRAVLNISIRATSASAYVDVWENVNEFSDNTVPSDTYVNIPEDINNPDLGIKDTVYLNYYYDPNNEVSEYCKIKNIPNYFQRCSIDITTNVKNVVDFDTPSSYHGLGFSTDSNALVEIANEDYTGADGAPTLEIIYRNIIGIENYWDYDQYKVGNSTVYVNNYNDEVTVVHTDAMIDSILPIELQHVYMDHYAKTNYNIDDIFTGANYGYGWKLNYQQIIRSRGKNFEYYDADGTMHYFSYDTEKGFAKDEDGLGLKIYSEPASVFRMEDSDGNNKYFDYHGRLFKITSKAGGTTNILYGNGNQPTISGLPITEINDNNGNSISFTYNTDGYLLKVSYKRLDGITIGSTYYEYADNKISKIINDDGTNIEYEYKNSTSKLLSLTAESGYKLELISDEMGVFESGIQAPSVWIIPPTAKIRSIWRSVNGAERTHVKDNVYCGGLTMNITAKSDGEYFDYVPFSVYHQMNNDDIDNLCADMSEAGKIIFLITIGWAYLIFYGYENTPIYLDYCAEYYESNYCIKKSYDIFGRLISSYTDEYPAQSVDLQYESANVDSINVNNNKVTAKATYSSNIANYIQDPSFENNGLIDGKEVWRMDNTYVSDKYSCHGQKSLVVFSYTAAGNSVTQSQYMLPGWYTLTGYIKVDNILLPFDKAENYGANIYVVQNGSILGRTEYVTEDSYLNNNSFKQVFIKFYVETAFKPVTIHLNLSNCMGFAYFDQLQATRSDYGVADSYNNALNAAFFYGGSTNSGLANWDLWDDIPQNDFQLISTNILGDTATGLTYVTLHNNGNGSVNLYQRVPLESNTQSTAYTASVWVRKDGNLWYMTPDDSYVGLNYRLYDKNMVPLDAFKIQKIDLPFSIWYKVACTFVAPPEAKYVEINIQVKNIEGSVMVDNAALVKSELINLEYDDFGNCSFYSDGYNKIKFNDGEGGASTEINGMSNYGVIKDDRGNIIQSTDFARQVKTEFSYDEKGRKTDESFATIDDSKRIETHTDYSYISNNLIEVATSVDSLGFQSIGNFYAYSGLLLSTTFNDGTFVEYDYGTESGNFAALPSVITITNKDSVGNELSSVQYNYMSIADELSKPAEYGHRHVGSLKSIVLDNGTIYSYVYDGWGNIIQIKINGVVQTSYTYDSFGNISSMTLANGYQESYIYNTSKQLVEYVAKDGNELIKHYYYEYDNSGNVIGQYDVIKKYCYINELDANDRVIVYAKGNYLEIGNRIDNASTGSGEAVPEYKQKINRLPIYDYICETVYDYYGEPSKSSEFYVQESLFSLDNLGITGAGNSVNNSITREVSGLTETIKLNNLTQITYTYNSTNSKYAKVVMEDNALLTSATYPNGIRIKYDRNSYGNITAITVFPYGSNNNGIVYSPKHNFIIGLTEFDVGYKPLWDLDWMLDNAIGVDSDNMVTAMPDDESNGITITNILKVHPQLFNSGTNYYSMVDPMALRNGILGTEITFWAKVVQVTGSGDSNIMVPRIRYTDNTVGSARNPINNVVCDKVINNGSWQFFSIPINTEKTITSLELPRNNDAWIAIGGMSLYGKKDAWDSDWAIEHSNADYKAEKMPAEKASQTNTITDILRVHQSSYYVANSGGVEIYQSLVDPDLLANGGDQIVLQYNARIQSLNPNYASRSDKDSLIRGLRFRYSDGSTDYAGNTNIAYTTNWQSFTLVSTPGKQVIGIELGYNYDSWILLGNINVAVKNLGRLDKRVNAQTLSNNAVIEYDYDALGRQTIMTLYADTDTDLAILSESQTYLDGTEGNTSFTIASKSISYGSTGDIVYNYTYNMDNTALGNLRAERSNPYEIFEIKEDNATKVTYEYDKLGRIIRENNAYINQTITYTYDGNNNIVSKTIYPYSFDALSGGNAISYAYGNTTFKDRLTTYNGQNITYDTLGNPIQYMGNTLVWQGRQLKSFDSITFDYDMNGTRISKGSTNYTYVGGMLQSESNGLNTINYMYNQSGLMGFNLNGNSYYYITNIFDDVMGIVDSSGTLVVQYIYDTWGKVISITGSMSSTVGAINPIRYRGYYYDVETELYYLQNRYYDPEIGRFISPDRFENLGKGSNTLSFNLYTYCNNNPVKYSDSDGNFAISSLLSGIALKAIMGAAIGAISYTVCKTIDYALTGNFDWSWGEFTGAVAGGMVSGVATTIKSTFINVTFQLAGGILTSAAGMYMANKFNEKNYSHHDILAISAQTTMQATIGGMLASALPHINLTGRLIDIANIEFTKRMMGAISNNIPIKISATVLCGMFGKELYDSVFTTLLGEAR